MDHFAGLDVSVKETSICIVEPRLPGLLTATGLGHGRALDQQTGH